MIDWAAAQAQVEALIAAHPADSGRCETLAAALLPLAKARDPEAHRVRITVRPGMGRFVLPSRRWYLHATTALERHFVDAMTGAAGCPDDTYSAAYFPYPEVLIFTPIREEP